MNCNSNNGLCGFAGNNWWWILILILIFCNGSGFGGCDNNCGCC